MRCVLVLMLLAVSGCFTGVLYTNTVRPLTLDLNRTPVVAGPGTRGSVTQVRYSYFDFRGGSNAIGGVALANGLGQVYYADLEVLRVLGVFTRTQIRVYGAPVAPEPIP